MFEQLDREKMMKDLGDLVNMVGDDRRSSFKGLIKHLTTNLGLTKSPASTKYHMSTCGGLLAHELSVAKTMLAIKNTVDPSIPDEKCVIVALLHDIGKLGYSDGQYYVENEPTEKQAKWGYKPNQKYRYNNDIMFMSHAHRSLYLIQEYGFRLSRDEFQAILIHDGQYIKENTVYAMKECSLALLLHMADLWSCKELEREETIRSIGDTE